MRLKILSLELMLGVLENSGPVLQGCMRFINGAIKKLLCNSILMNGVSPVPRVFQASLSLFCTLIAKFNQHLKVQSRRSFDYVWTPLTFCSVKNEIGLIFTDIIIFILETPTSTILQRWLVIQVLERIFKSPQTLVDIFLNYDSDLKGANIFEKLVNDISAIAKASFPLENSPAPTQEVRTLSLSLCVCVDVDTLQLAMRHLALECLVTIMQSLVDFSKELAAPPQSIPAGMTNFSSILQCFVFCFCCTSLLASHSIEQRTMTLPLQTGLRSSTVHRPQSHDRSSRRRSRLTSSR